MKWSKSKMPQRRHGDPVETWRLPSVCRCDLDGRLRYTGYVERSPSRVIGAWFDCPHGRRWFRSRRRP